MSNAAVAAIAFALEPTTDEGLVFLEYWNEGSFDICRREWPQAPEACYIGADLMHPETVKLMKAQSDLQDHAENWRMFLKLGDFSAATDFGGMFWRGVINLPTHNHPTVEAAIANAVKLERLASSKKAA